MADSNGTNKDGYKVIGTRPIRHDGLEKVTGQAKYGADFFVPRDAVRQDSAQSACACADQVD